jgi:arsenate reductase
MLDVIIYHNPDCGTSRNTLGMIRNAGIEPHIIQYLKSPPTKTLLLQLLNRAELSVRQGLRQKDRPYSDLKLDNPELSDGELLDAMITHPVLVERPLVVTPKGVRLCRPPELVLDLLPPQRGEFFKEDGEQVIDRNGNRVATA